MSDGKTVEKQKENTDKELTIDWDAWRKIWTPKYKREQELKAEKYKNYMKYPAGYLYEEWKKTIPDFETTTFSRDFGVKIAPGECCLFN